MLAPSVRFLNQHRRSHSGSDSPRSAVTASSSFEPPGGPPFQSQDIKFTPDSIRGRQTASRDEATSKGKLLLNRSNIESSNRFGVDIGSPIRCLLLFGPNVPPLPKSLCVSRPRRAAPPPALGRSPLARAILHLRKEGGDETASPSPTLRDRVIFRVDSV